MTVNPWFPILFPMKKTKVYSNISEIADPFKGILLDAYGVFWGGNEVGVLPGCEKIMADLVDGGKIVGIVSNTTQLSQNELDKLKKHGLIQGKHFHFLITSGEVAKKTFSEGQLPFQIPKKTFYSFGKPHPKFSSHQMIFADSFYKETSDISEADFIFVTVPHINGEDQINPHVFFDDVFSLRYSNLPMICTNPDRFAHEGNPARLVVRQGAIAAMYEELGGEVFYIGKPSPMMFTEAMKTLNNYNIHNKKDVLMVGDTPETDIRGAVNFQIASALTTESGIMAERLAERNLQEFLDLGYLSDHPTYFLSGLA